MNATFAVPMCRKCTLGYWPEGGSMSGTSIKIGVPVGHGSIQVPALSVKAMVVLVCLNVAIVRGFHFGT